MQEYSAPPGTKFGWLSKIIGTVQPTLQDYT